MYHIFSNHDWSYFIIQFLGFVGSIDIFGIRTSPPPPIPPWTIALPHPPIKFPPGQFPRTFAPQTITLNNLSLDNCPETIAPYEIRQDSYPLDFCPHKNYPRIIPLKTTTPEQLPLISSPLENNLPL